MITVDTTYTFQTDLIHMEKFEGRAWYDLGVMVYENGMIVVRDWITCHSMQGTRLLGYRHMGTEVEV